MMTIRSRGAAIALGALAGTMAGSAPAAAQTSPPALAPLSVKAVRNSPIHAIPADDAEQGSERQAAMGEDAGDGTLNGQYAALLRAAATPAALSAAPASAQPQPAADTPSVAIARRVIDAAGAFERYMRLAAGVHADFGDGSAVSHALDTGATYEQAQLEEGAVAYAALAALQEPAFVQTLSRLSPDPQARIAVTRQLIEQPEAILQAPGAARAAARAALVIGRMGGALYASGAAVKQAAYDVQRQPWSHAAIPAPQAQLARLKAQSAALVTLKPEDTAALMTSLVEMRRSGESPATPGGPVSPLVARGLALAALAVLGQADEDHAEQIAPLLAEARTADCVKLARLSLYECLSVAGPQYENVFCLGQHAMMDTAQCVVKAAGWTLPTAAPTNRSVSVPIAVEPAAPAAPPVMVPVAVASADPVAQ